MSHDAKIRFQKGTQIGSGASGEVFLGRNVDTGELMAIKDIALDSADEHLDQKEIELRKEIEVMKSLDHPNVVRYLQTTKDAVKDGFSVSIIMEYAAGGSISRQLREFGPLEDAVCRRNCIQILCGLAYLHNRGLVHRDIKGANILIGADSVCKLADFGSVGILNNGDSPLTSPKGTPNWMAPEVVTRTGHGWQADIWSFGCTVMEMLTAVPPFQHVSSHPLAVMWFVTDRQRDITLPDAVSGAVSDFLLLMLNRDPSQRPAAPRLLQHLYLNPEPSHRHAAETQHHGAGTIVATLRIPETLNSNEDQREPLSAADEASGMQAGQGPVITQAHGGRRLHRCPRRHPRLLLSPLTCTWRPMTHSSGM
jgi:serine/threonine protein kinase